MNKKKIDKILFLVSMISGTFIFTSCIVDRITLFCIKNCTNDTLLIELTDSDTLYNWMYWGKHPEDTMRPIVQEDTTWVYIHGEKVIIDNFFYALPDSTVFASPHVFNINDTCYIYAIKWQVATRFPPEEIRAKKLYDRRAVTKRDFHNRLFEYRSADFAGDH